MLTGTMASPKSKRRSRKPRSTGNAPRAVASQRREERAQRQAQAASQSRAASRQLGSVGERPKSPFDPVPVSELAILIGGIGLIAGFFTGGGAAVIVGAVVCALGVLEFTVREHISGFRSHTTLLAAVPAVLVEALIAAIFGTPKQRILVLLPAIPVFALGFFLLRRQFQAARHARVARPPAP